MRVIRAPAFLEPIPEGMVFSNPWYTEVDGEGRTTLNGSAYDAVTDIVLAPLAYTAALGFTSGFRDPPVATDPFNADPSLAFPAVGPHAVVGSWPTFYRALDIQVTHAQCGDGCPSPVKVLIAAIMPSVQGVDRGATIYATCGPNYTRLVPCIRDAPNGNPKTACLGAIVPPLTAVLTDALGPRLIARWRGGVGSAVLAWRFVP